MTERLGFLGGGQMALALATGAVESGMYLPQQMVFCEPALKQQQKLREAFPGCEVVDTADSLLGNCHRIILAVKPQVLREIGAHLQPWVSQDHLLLSIVAGFSLPQLATLLGTQRLVRVMPNTPAQVMAGASGMAFGEGVTEEDRSWAEHLMRGVGLVVATTDQHLHAVTGLSGSGPAYVLLVIEALADGGVAAGLGRDVAMQLAVQTVLGTAKMVQASGQHPAVLRDQVTSPGGTTIAALQVLENRGVRSAFIDAVMAATQRSRNLGS